MSNLPALIKVVPSSVSATSGTATVSSTGQVTFTTATTVSVNGVFSASYENYLAVVDGVASGDTGINLRLRVSGSDNSTANSYVHQQQTAEGSTAGAAQFTGDLARIANFSNVKANGFHLYFYQPAVAARSLMRTVTVSSRSSNTYWFDVIATHNQTVAYDGFTVIAAANNLTGTLTVYGFNE